MRLAAIDDLAKNQKIGSHYQNIPNEEKSDLGCCTIGRGRNSGINCSNSVKAAFALQEVIESISGTEENIMDDEESTSVSKESLSECMSVDKNELNFSNHSAQHELIEDPGTPTRDNTSKPIANPLTPTRDNTSSNPSTNPFDESDIENEIFLPDDHSLILTDNFSTNDKLDEKGNKSDEKEQNGGNVESMKLDMAEMYENDIFFTANDPKTEADNSFGNTIPSNNEEADERRLSINGVTAGEIESDVKSSIDEHPNVSSSSNPFDLNYTTPLNELPKHIIKKKIFWVFLVKRS